MNFNVIALWQKAARYEPINPTGRAFLRLTKTAFINALSLLLTIIGTAIQQNGFVNLQVVINGAIVAGISVLLHTGAKLYSASNDPAVKVAGAELSGIATEFDKAHPEVGADPLSQNTAIQAMVQAQMTQVIEP